MFREILVPLDGSLFSEQALPVALAIAGAARARLNLAHVHAPVVTTGHVRRVAPVLAFDLVESNEVALRDAQRYLDGVTGQLLAARSGVPISHALLVGDVSQALLRHAQELGADLVVMTTRGRGPLGKALIGSVADRVVRASRLPVLLLRPTDELPMSDAISPLRHILVPLDGSARAEEILEPALALGRITGAHYTLVRVVEWPGLEVGYPSVPHGAILEGRSAEAEAARTYLDVVATRLRAEGVEVNARVVVHPRPAEAILAVAEDVRADVIALSTRGQTGARRLLLGSVADRIVRGARLPVLVRRPVARRDAVEGGSGRELETVA